MAAPIFRVGCLVWLAVMPSACGDAPADRSEVPATTQETPAGVVDWNRREVSLRAPGWSIEFCEGEAPFLCVGRGEGQVGSIELLQLPVEDHTVIDAVLARDGSEREALEAAAAEFHAALAADRSAGYGEEYQLRAEPPAAATVMGKPGLRLVLEGRLGDRVLERIVQYHVILEDTLYLLAATGTEGGGPMGGFATDDLKAFEPVFAEIAAASRVHSPEGAAGR